MSFPRYAEYKDSDVEWLGAVPTHWTIVPLGRITTSRCDGPFGSGLKSEHYTESGARVIRLQNIRSEGFNCGDAAFLDIHYFESEMRNHDVRGGDVLIAGLGDDNNHVGRACVAPDDLGLAMVKADCFRFRLDSTVANPDFIARQLSAGAIFAGGQLATGTTRSRIPLSATAARRVAVPPLPEQRAISAFVRGETSKIESLIGEQEKLIALLKEKRQALVSHAVTRGLDPAAPMKDSMIDWLGQVPAHWALTPIKYLAEFRSGGTPSKANESFWDGDVPWASAKDMKPETLTDTSDHITDHAVENGGADVLPTATVLVVVRGMILARIFPVALTARPMAINQDLKALLPRSGLTARYLAWYLRGTAEESLTRLDEAGHGTKALRMDAWTSLTVALPPLAEQLHIAEHLDRGTAQLDELKAEAQYAIDLLKERRSALISAAVTGKIDIREFATEPHCVNEIA